MRTLFAILSLATLTGCQNPNWAQNGNIPMRVPPPATGSYQVPNQYSQIGAGASQLSASSTLVPANTTSTNLNSVSTVSSLGVQPAAFNSSLTMPTTTGPKLVEKSAWTNPSFP